MYAAPEIFSATSGYTEKVDIWSCGVMAYVLLSGNFPFESKNKILKGEWKFEGEVWDSISAEAKDCITKMLEYEEEDRPSAQDVINHDWIKKVQVNVPKELVVETLKRIRTNKVMSRFL